MHAVMIAGGGPTGLMLAGELAFAEIDVVIVERRATQEVDGSRAGGLYPRTLEVLDQGHRSPSGAILRPREDRRRSRRRLGGDSSTNDGKRSVRSEGKIF